MCIHELIWGYTGMVLALLGSVGLLYGIISQIILWVIGRKYVHKVRKLNTTEESSTVNFHKLTTEYISKVISIKNTSMFKNPFTKADEGVWRALYNMYINEGPQKEYIKEINKKLDN